MKSSDSISQHYQNISQKLETVLNILEELMENPLFIDQIHGEQEIGLDQAFDLLDTISVQFEPVEEKAEFRPLAFDDSYDAE